jgi:hypothetical protein
MLLLSIRKVIGGKRNIMGGWERKDFELMGAWRGFHALIW